ncbi:SIR2 family protein [Lactobacillus johnsonii]|uniref:SIR2 family protein n=1 Tax=Lactobacillus johnsonii TaxID=33959 RepID=UPI0036D3C293
MNKTNSIPNSYVEAKRLIQEAKKDDQLVLFVGAGVSINSGMPSWKDAVEQIGNLLGISEIDNSDYLKIPQYYYNSHGKQAYNSLMREIFKDGIKLPVSDIHRKILRFNPRTIITTNYDDLIERASEEHGEIRQTISQDIDIPYRKYNKELIKMHGDFIHDNFVLKEEDYLNYSNNFKLIENYIKSIIGSKVLLFIGYSFNDPDLKQIFNWVKNIVGEDMRISYLINADSEYDENEEQYYKKLGIQIIYASRLNQNSNVSTNISNNLNNVLDYLLGSSNNLDLVDNIYTELKEYDEFAYLTIKYLNNILSKYSLYISNNLFLCANPDNQKIQKTLNLLCSDLDHISDPVEKMKVKKIIQILHKSMIRGIKSERQIKEFSEELKKDEIEEYVFTFNWQKLNELRDKNGTQLGENNGNLLLQQASISYYLGDYLSTYNYLKRAGLALFRERSYGLYYISQVNRKWIRKIIIDSSYRLNVDTSVIELIREENDIDINQMLDRSIETTDKGTLIRDINGWNYSYTIFQDLYDLNLESFEQANTDYMLFQGVPAYEGAAHKALDLFNFVSKNHLLLDKYKDISDNYKLYIRTILASITSEEKINSFDPLIHTGNIKKDYLDNFDLFTIIRYFSSSRDVYKLFERYQSLSFIDLNNEGIEYLEKIVPSILSSHYKDELRNDIYWRLLCICGFVKLNKNIVNLIIENFTNYLSDVDTIEHRDIIRQFFINIKNQNLVNNKNISQIQKIATQVIMIIIRSKAENISSIIYFFNHYLNEEDTEYDYNKIIDEAIKNNYDIALIYTYRFSTKEAQNRIATYFKNRSFQSKEIEIKTNIDLANFDIIELDEKTENDILNYLKTKDTRAEDEHMLSQDIRQITHGFTKVCIEKKEKVDKDTIDVISKYAMPEDRWLINYKNFNYEEFKLDWLKRCDCNILKQISANKVVKNEIKNRLIQSFKNSKLSSELEEIYFYYFA